MTTRRRAGPGATPGVPVAQLTGEEARAVALRAQGFLPPDDPSPGPAAGGAPIDVLDRLGAIQLDSVNVIARSQELIPAARIGPYSPAALRRAVYAERRGFEYWGHAASWLPMAEYRYFRFRMAAFRERHREFREASAPLLAHVLDRIRAEGPLGAAAFEDPRPGRATWWDWKPAKRALEVLFAGGELTAAGRTAGFARLYDLPERVLPAGLDVSDPGPAGAARHLLRRAVAALGVATAADAADYFRLQLGEARPALDALLTAGELVRVEVAGWPVPGLATPAALAGPHALTLLRHQPAFLSPFDSLVWDRRRTERLFGFRYRIELYTPQARRPFGYYVLPLLAGGRLAGRADVKLERREGRLRVRRLRLEAPSESEEGEPATAAAGGAPEGAGAALRSLADHLGAGEVLLERMEPEGARGAVLRAAG